MNNTMLLDPVAAVPASRRPLPRSHPGSSFILHRSSLPQPHSLFIVLRPPRYTAIFPSPATSRRDISCYQISTYNSN